ncbi:MmgE/PrpD family protein [Phytohabitans kaempferiae]|uniref:MmgE/PrpD family protein n=1 Tax=Phytohabitans kaempferiae TaxID=1620943 RepID=A0ABV6M756_9ACTN
MGDASAALAQLVAGTTPGSLPPACTELARRGILDALGCGLYGAALPHVAWIRDGLDASSGGATLWGHRRGVAADQAALANGTAVHATEMSETFIRAVVHPGNVVVPAAVAVAEALGSTGAQLLTAVAVGYEVLARCGLAAGTGALMEQRLHTFSLLGPFGAAAAVAKLRFDDDADRVHDTLGIAATLAPTALLDAAREGATVKDVFEGHAAALGVVAGRYASLGVTGMRRWTDEWFPAVIRTPDLDRLTDGIGDRWEMARGGLRIKLRPVMGLVQPTVAAVLDLLDRQPVAVSDIAAVRVDSTRRAMIATETAPATVTGAKASIPFTVAALLHRTRAARTDPYLLDFYTEELLRDPDVLALAARCTVHLDEDFERHFETDAQMRYESRVTITRHDGARVTGYADIWPATSRLTFDEVTGKFTACATRGGVADPARIVEAVRRLEDLDDVRRLGELLAPDARHTGRRDPREG